MTLLLRKLIIVHHAELSAQQVRRDRRSGSRGAGHPVREEGSQIPGGLEGAA